jgi:uncharacterized protein (DUF2147 family)
MTRLVALAVAALCLAVAHPAHAADISGVWLTDTADAHIRMAKCSTAASGVASGVAMCGTIIWLKQPIDPRTGQPLTDSKNPDPARRGQPMIGTVIALNFVPSREDPNKYVGHFYNADDGNTYEGHITLPSPDALNVTGCLLFICQTQTWTRVKR